MFDDILAIGTNTKNSYYFQIVPLELTLGKNSQLPSQGTTFRFSVHKGHHQFDENKHPIQANFQEKGGVMKMAVSACKLNFYIPNFMKIRHQNFQIKMTQQQCNQDFEIGQYSIEPAPFIEEFEKKIQRKYILRTFFSQHYELDFQLYIEKTRANLEVLVKDSRQMMASRQRKSILKKDNNEFGKKRTYTAAKIKKEPQKSDPDSFTNRVRSAQKNIDIPPPIKINNNRNHSLQSMSPTTQELHPKAAKLFRMFTDDNEYRYVQDNSIVKLPLIQTKFKQLAKVDTPHEIKMTQSQRLSELHANSITAESQCVEEHNQKCVLMWVYILVFTVLLFVVMHPKHRL